MFSVTFSNSAAKALRDVDSKLEARLKELFVCLSQNPVPAKEFGVKKLDGFDAVYRIRLSSHRVVYAVYWNEKVIRVSSIERRSETTYK